MYDEGKNREETSTACEAYQFFVYKFPIRIRPAWELRPKPFHSKRRPMPTNGRNKGSDDELNFLINTVIVLAKTT